MPFFVCDNDVFRGNDAARGPWSADHCHAGPVAGLIARALERAAGDQKSLTRLTIDLVRPVPLSGFQVTSDLLRNGHKLATARAEVTDLQGRVCATASSMHLAETSMEDMATAALPSPDLTRSTPGRFPVAETNHGLPAFADFIDVAYPPKETPAPGPTTIWMRTPHLIPDEHPSPVQSICPLADCGSGISRYAPLSEVNFMNTDITIAVHRQPSGYWFASQAVSHWHDTGIGLAEARLFDRLGPIATVLQTLVLQPC